jgi:hypothetical protein
MEANAMSDELDLLLSQRLEEPEDGGFSSRVFAELGRVCARDDRLATSALVLASCLVLALLSLTHAGQAAALSASRLAYSVPFALAISLLFLSRLLLDAIPE